MQQAPFNNHTALGVFDPGYVTPKGRLSKLVSLPARFVMFSEKR